MATAAEPLSGLPQAEASQELARSWKKLTRAATVVAVLTSPVLYIWFTQNSGLSWWQALLATVAIVVVFRGFADLLFRRLIPSPSLFGIESRDLREEDVVARRRLWFWKFWFKIGIWFFVVITILWLFRGGSYFGTITGIVDGIGHILSTPTLWVQVVFVFFLFIANFGIMFGPLLAMNLTQIKTFEPGDAQWGVKLDDVRGQLEAKEEVRRVVSIWQSGEQFERHGGKRERGVLFFGPPGTGKTMLAKALATGFNSPFVSIPGSGFAATFIGIDAIVVRFLAWKAKRAARKWGGTCIVFIDEIDAVGMRRQSLGTGFGGAINVPPLTPMSPHEDLFYGPWGSLNPSGDMVLETRAWREKLFASRETPTIGMSGFAATMMRFYGFMFPGGMGGGGGMALNQLLVVMDGIDNPPFMRRVITNKTNTLLDASFIVPRRVKGKSLRLPAPRPRSEQVYFIGATNVPIDRLDPALIRPGRMGRHVWFRTPTKHDRLDIIDLYINKVSHDPDLDMARRRDEIARVTNGYSPAMIEQVTSMALTIAHHSGRERFSWEDLVESITTLESGTAIGIEYIEREGRAIAIHEAGHAIAGHTFMKDFESTRLSIRRRGDSGGHHQAREKEERFARFQSEMFAQLVWGLGAMAAERVFYDENSTGVGGDVMAVTAQTASMVGAAAMGPQPFHVTPKEGETEEEARGRVLERFEGIGMQIMNRMGGGGQMAPDPISSALSDPSKRRAASQIIGQAYVVAHNLAKSNTEALDRIAGVLMERKEIFGDELLDLLDSVGLRVPELDYGDESVWPPPFFTITSRERRPREIEAR
ncbi:AAA family ATPase [Gaiella sp.]|uniref:AAA family ATPase n=1 Tax=Gaiella sp. TaxID=2663207 RepID=UPI002E337134|nr:AAA family ATPase [Gaiella sp.]HEX5582967.1 AAA family ATPase [Gaiella sp.]